MHVCDVIVVDHAQCLPAIGGAHRVEEVDELSEGVRRVALRVPTFSAALSKEAIRLVLTWPMCADVWSALITTAPVCCDRQSPTTARIPAPRGELVANVNMSVRCG